MGSVLSVPTLRTPSLGQTVEQGGFVWLTGIEDTFITAPHPKTGRTLDEYELTDHYVRWQSDLGLMAELGVGAARYGIPWHLVNPGPGQWDFSWAERPIERLLELGIEPVVDLVHYGVPSWIPDAFLNPDYELRVEEYAARVAARFGDRVRAYTPLNEPRITAWYAGKLGFWPPFRRGWSGFVQVSTALARGIVRTTRAIESQVKDATIVHVDAGDVYVPSSEEHREEAELRQLVGFLTLDLVSGRVNEAHPLFRFLTSHGAPVEELARFSEQPLTLDVIGINAYPLFSRKVLKRVSGRVRMTMPYASGDVLERLAELYHARYERPIIISETASEGTVARRRAWLEESVAAIARARARGIPVTGYTWWPLFALVAWAYRRGERPIAHYLKQMGLWDLRADPLGSLERVRTPLVDEFRRLATGGLQAVGPLVRNANPNAR